MNTVRIGLAGAGFAARYQMACLRRVYGAAVQIAGVYAPHRPRRQAFAEAHQIAAFDDLDALIAASDVVSICSPPYAHQEAICRAAQAGRGVICEKPLTGYFGPPGADDAYRGDRDGKAAMLAAVMERLAHIKQTVERAGVFFGYAENFVYAMSVQKEAGIVRQTSAQILRMVGEESHSGSASPVYGIWRYAGGGSLIGKGVHPLGAMLYLKRLEGLCRTGRPIRPKTVSARVHQLTRLQGYDDRSFLRTDYHDVEDYGLMHIVFEDGTAADVVTSEVVLGGIYDYVEVFANNHRTRCAISPVHLADAYNPGDERFKEVYLVEKCSTQKGWSPAAPDENLTMGYQQEFQDFVSCFAAGQDPQSGLPLALDVTAAVYAAYLSDEQKGTEIEIPLL